ncbi:MAG: hypothetical protein UX68_C0015G0005 [Parcubacteria group bacterium GW2011_GWA2_46_9]|nr:MAG: hypothetical protein UX68_C0015G0005 [Parcubacteria group bacterium GW2011_GWA2_46_9]
MLKQVQYGTGSRKGTVVYTINGSRCIFSGISGQAALSTINAAEAIVRAIVAQEKVEPLALMFFDLQTRSGYASKGPGQFDFNRLDVHVVGHDITVVGWITDECSDDDRELFRQYI